MMYGHVLRLFQSPRRSRTTSMSWRYRLLPVPGKGNRVTYFAGAMVQGAKAPRGFGVRVTAAGARAFVLNYACAAVNSATRSAPGPTGRR
jgi:hypothetical protein